VEPIENLELRAIEQRNRMHQTADELRAKVADGREKLRQKLNVADNARQHFTVAAAAVSFVALALGYSAGGLFTGR
jgi:hypothetical protein